MPWDPNFIDSQVLAIHAALMPTGIRGEILFFGGDEHWDWNQKEGIDPANFNKTRIFDVATGSITEIDSPTTDVFCSGHSALPDGRLLVGGGTARWPTVSGHNHDLGFAGHRACWIYQPRNRSWKQVADMNPQPGYEAAKTGGGRWYPMLITLANGEVLAVFGHPSESDIGRHRNNNPERYSATSNRWTLLPPVPGSEEISYLTIMLNYPRLHLLPDGKVFFSTPVNGNHFYDPSSGTFVGPVITATGLPLYDKSWHATSVLLPLLPGDGYKPRVMVCGAKQPKRINLAEASPMWQNTAPRDGDVADKARKFLSAVILPNGEVFITGGMNSEIPLGAEPDTSKVLKAEIYRPGIAWDTGTYTGIEEWKTVEAATVPRNYHSVALLMPDGRVWTAGSSKNSLDGNPAVVGEKRIEIYNPAYYADPARPEITEAPANVSYGQVFEVRSPQASLIRRVALIRNASVTHAFDFDHRYVGLVSNHAGGDRLEVTAPPKAEIAPPGYYTLWIVDEAGLPCKLAKFIRVAKQECYAIKDRSTFSEHEVKFEVKKKGKALSENALYIVFDNFLPQELGDPPIQPTPVLTFDSPSGPSVPNMFADSKKIEFEGPPDVAQRVTFVYDIRFVNTEAFNAISSDQRQVNVHIEAAGHACDTTLDLIKKPNPFMVDGETAWLSADLRVFKVREGKDRFGIKLEETVNDDEEEAATTAINFIRALIPKFRGLKGAAPFEEIDNEKLELLRKVKSKRVFNFAVARVHYRSELMPAEKVKVFFRLFNTANTALEYSTYRIAGSGENAISLLGLQDNEMVSIPFFAERRITASEKSMREQRDDINVQTLDKTDPALADEFVGYFGCWLDFNQTIPQLPATIPVINPDGPYDRDVLKSIQELRRGDHSCLVAEIYFEPDPTPIGAAPGSSDNLAQRNLVIVKCANPGHPASRTIQHTFEVMPASGGTVEADSELILRWNNLPRDTQVTLYLPDVDADEILNLVAERIGPPLLVKVDDHTLRCIVGDIAYVPLPGGRDKNIPGLITLELPDGVVKGQEFTVTLHQHLARRIIGAIQITIPVTTAAEILPEEVQRLSVMRHIATAIPAGDRWASVFARYLDQITSRVRALGGDPDSIAPSPDGSGMASKGVTILFRSPQYYLLHLDRLPGGTVLIGGVNLNVPVSASNAKAIKLALGGGQTPLQRLNEEFVAAQLSLNAAGGSGSPVAFNALWTLLDNYGLKFATVRLSNDYNLSPNSMLGELFEQTRLAIRENRTQDMMALATLLDLLNGNDPLGR